MMYLNISDLAKSEYIVYMYHFDMLATQRIFLCNMFSGTVINWSQSLLDWVNVSTVWIEIQNVPSKVVDSKQLDSKER